MLVDAEVSRLLRQAERRAGDLLRHHRAELDELTRRLLDEETLDGTTVYGLVGGRAAPVLVPAAVSGNGRVRTGMRCDPATSWSNRPPGWH